MAEMDIKYLPEQQAVIEATEPCLKVRAGAGTGKTSTLVGYAKARPSKRMLYLAFNKAIQLEAETKFPKNTTCRTVHSIAYGKVAASRYKHKLAFGTPRANEIARTLKTNVVNAFHGINTLNAFLYSADSEIGVSHAFSADVVPEQHARAIDCAKAIWKAMRAPEGDVAMVHDGYLKLYHLEGHVPTGFDLIMMDEAQDANPVTAAIVDGFSGGKVYVGDQNQGVYAFRGAQDAMEGLGAPEYPLSTSFRFGQPVADVANILLEYAIADDMRLTGAGKGSEVDGRRFSGSTALIARTNGKLIGYAMDLINEGKSFHVVGGPESLRLGILMDAYHLYSRDNGNIKTPYIRQFESWANLERVAEDIDDPELTWLVGLVKKYGHGIPGVVTDIRNNCLPSSSGAAEILSTAHKSKGLEFDNVMLADDFKPLSDPEGVDIQEANLLYVAVTRAKRSLHLNDEVREFIASPVMNPKAESAKRKTRQKAA